MFARRSANCLGNLLIGERQNPVAQRLVDRRKAIEAQEVDDGSAASCR